MIWGTVVARPLAAHPGCHASERCEGRPRLVCGLLLARLARCGASGPRSWQWVWEGWVNQYETKHSPFQDFMKEVKAKWLRSDSLRRKVIWNHFYRFFLPNGPYPLLRVFFDLAYSLPLTIINSFRKVTYIKWYGVSGIVKKSELNLAPQSIGRTNMSKRL